MDIEKIVDRKQEEFTTNALSLYQKGNWKDALSILEKVYKEKNDSAEICSALAICKLFSTGIQEPDNSKLEGKDLESIVELLGKEEMEPLPDVAVCRIWLQLSEKTKPSYESIANEIELLIDACKQSNWFPIWSLTFRLLAYYDQRQKIKNILSEKVEKVIKISDGFRLIFAEAYLECGSHISTALSLLQNINPERCLPLRHEVAYIWQQFLLAEFDWWQNHSTDGLDTVQSKISNILKASNIKNDLYSYHECKRIAYLVLSSETRVALYQRNFEKARKLIKLSSQYNIRSWEIEYLKGLLAWAQRDFKNAEACLQQSLELNPFQSRVHFENEILAAGKASSNSLTMPEAIPGVHDSIASAAMALIQSNQNDKAQQHLNQLDQAEKPYSLRLICPQARALRLRQGRELQAYLAEIKSNWLSAIEYLDSARTISKIILKSEKTDSSSRAKDLIYRTHQLYLMSRYFQTSKFTSKDSTNSELFTRFQKELGKLSIFPLTDEAMFYRSLAARKYMPDRAQKDWRALLRQTKWLNKMQKLEPKRILYIGDQLFKIGLIEDAQKAFNFIKEICLPEAIERALAINVILCQNLEPIHLLSIIESTQDVNNQKEFWHFLHGICLLAQKPPTYEEASVFLNKAIDSGLSSHLSKLSELLLSLAPFKANRNQKIYSFINDSNLKNLPSSIQIGLNTLNRPNGNETIRNYIKIFGNKWINYCPISPELIIGIELRDYYTQFDFEAAIATVQESEKLGVQIPVEWKFHIYIAQSIQLTLMGNFELAQIACQQAQELLSLNNQEVEKNEIGIQ